MNLQLVFRHRSNSQHLEDLAQRALAHALDRFADRIRDARLCVEDVNSKRGGVDQRGSLALLLEKGQTLHFETLCETPEAAIHELADLARAAMSRHLERRRRTRRHVPQ